jgi:drug/metabolite transporter (DMT)-like permease
VVSESALGGLYAVLCALSWAVIGMLVRSLAHTFNSVSLNAVRSTLGSVLILAWVLGHGWPDRAHPRCPGGPFVLLAVSVLLAVWLGDTVFFESTRDLGLARAMTVSMSYPLIAALLAAFFLDEPLTPRLAIGSVLTLGGVVLTVVGETAIHRGRARSVLDRRRRGHAGVGGLGGVSGGAQALAR